MRIKLFGMIMTLVCGLMMAIPTVAAAQSRKGDVVFLRGIAGVFSLGLDEIAERLERQGIDSKVLIHGNWKRAARAIQINNRKHGPRPVFIIGHSLGANAAVRLARFLQGKGIKVDHLVTLDPTVRQTIPGNVAVAENYYLPQSIWGKPLSGAADFRGKLTNIPLDTTKDFGHFNMDENRQLQDKLIREVVNLLRKKSD